MPIFDYHCTPCRQTFEGLTTLADHDRCPICNEKAEKVFTPCSFVANYDSSFEDVDSMSPLKRQMLLNHQKYIESRADDVKSGALKIDVKGPKALRPRI